MALPEKLQEIVEDFEFLEGQEKLMHLLELSEQLPDLPERLQSAHDRFEQVHECMSPVFILAEKEEDDTLSYYFDIPREAPTVRGFGMILFSGLAGLTAQQVLEVPNDFYLKLGLREVLSGQRLNGIGAILRYMQNLARKEISA